MLVRVCSGTILIRNNSVSLKANTSLKKKEKTRTYKLQLGAQPKKSNIKRIQTFQNIINTLYLSNPILHKDLATKTVFEKAHYVRFHKLLQNHPDPLVKDLSVITLLGNPFTNLFKNFLLKNNLTLLKVQLQ